MSKITNEQLFEILGTHTKLFSKLERYIKRIDKRVKNTEKGLTDIDFKMYETNKKLGTINERTESYPKLYDNVDKLVGEILENRQERTFLNQKIQNHEKRLFKLETISS